MKVLSPEGEAITLPRNRLESYLCNVVHDLHSHLIPLASRLIRDAVESKVPPQSPPFMAAVSTFSSASTMYCLAACMADDLAKGESRYADAMVFLKVGGHAADAGLPSDILDRMDLGINQFRLNIEKFLRAIDPEDTLLDCRQGFDPEI